MISLLERKVEKILILGILEVAKENEQRKIIITIRRIYNENNRTWKK